MTFHGVDARGRQVRLRPPLRRVALASGAVMGMVFGPVAVFTALPLNGISATISTVLVTLGSVIVMALLETHVEFGGVVAGRLAAGRCPKCLYSIDDLPSEEDDCTVCPECGSAWRLKGIAKTPAGGEASRG